MTAGCHVAMNSLQRLCYCNAICPWYVVKTIIIKKIRAILLFTENTNTSATLNADGFKEEWIKSIKSAILPQNR